MLILTRRPGETVYIGEEVTVTVLGVIGHQVRFGIEAPRSITIDRAEIYERKKRAALGDGNGNTSETPAAPPVEANGNVAPHDPFVVMGLDFVERGLSAQKAVDVAAEAARDAERARHRKNAQKKKAKAASK